MKNIAEESDAKVQRMGLNIIASSLSAIKAFKRHGKPTQTITVATKEHKVSGLLGLLELVGLVGYLQTVGLYLGLLAFYLGLLGFS
jgi:hypothetical protein